MNVYDFDGTIYNGDSSVDFILYCMRKRPRLARFVFRQICAFMQHAFGRISTKSMKEKFFSFLAALDDTNALVDAFWESHKTRIRDWYVNQRECTDVIISASPEFLLDPICAVLMIQPPIATCMGMATGTINGENCKGAEKVVRFTERYPRAHIARFYSDTLSDTPLAQIASEAFLVKKNKILPWPTHLS